MIMAGLALASTGCGTRCYFAPCETVSRIWEITPPATPLQRQSVAMPSILTTLERSYGITVHSSAYLNADLMQSSKVNPKWLPGGEHRTALPGHEARRP